MNFVDISGKAFNTIGPGDYSLFEYIDRVIQREPIDAVDPATLGVFAAIGIEKGKPFAPDARMEKILRDAAQVGDATARTLAYDTRVEGAHFYPNSAWVTPSQAEVIRSSRMALSILAPKRCSSSTPPASHRR